VDEIASAVESLDLGNFAQTYADNIIRNSVDGGILYDLETKEDFVDVMVELGVASNLHKRVLLQKLQGLHRAFPAAANATEGPGFGGLLPQASFVGTYEQGSSSISFASADVPAQRPTTPPESMASVMARDPYLPTYAYSCGRNPALLRPDDTLVWRSLTVSEQVNTRAVVYALDWYEKLKTIRKNVRPEAIFNQDKHLSNFLSYYFRQLLEEGKVIGLCKKSNLASTDSKTFQYEIPTIVPDIRAKKTGHPTVEDRQSTVFAMLFYCGLHSPSLEPVFVLLVKHEKGPSWDPNLTFKPWKCALVGQMLELEMCLKNTTSMLATMFPSPLPIPDDRFLPLKTANFFFSADNEPISPSALRFNPSLANQEVNIILTHIMQITRHFKEHELAVADRSDRLPEEVSHMPVNDLATRIKFAVERSLIFARESPSFVAVQHFTGNDLSSHIQ